MAKADRHVQRILDSFSSWEAALKDHIWIVMGDNGQAWISGNKKEALIDLRSLLDAFRIVKLKKGVTADDDIVLAVNERMAFIYSLDKAKLPLKRIADILQKDERIDIICWKNEADSIEAVSGEQHGKLTFRPGGKCTDEFGQTWTLEGDLHILDLTVEQNSLTYGKFPDALARLYASFFLMKAII